MKFEEGYKIITLINQVDGEIYPESRFPENARKFRGFDWREEERPISVEDLFSDDPPLELPIIKGLDEYIPEEEFFDEAMFKRMDTAREKDKDEVNKASRNLPKSVKEVKKKRDAVKQNLPKPLINEDNNGN